MLARATRPCRAGRLRTWSSSLQPRYATSTQTLLICTILRALRTDDVKLVQNVADGITQKLTGRYSNAGT